MRTRLDFSRLRNTKPADLAWRFLLGGAITASAGWIASVYGPAAGGLFLAFPAILPASLTLVAKDQERRKAQRGLHGIVRGRQAAALDARGALMGCAGLAAFAVSVHVLAPRVTALVTLAAATAVWFAVATVCWRLRHAIRSLLRRDGRASSTQSS